jgi:lipoprotein NlpD
MRSIPPITLRALMALTAVSAVLVAMGCSSRSLNNAPVQDRSTSSSRPSPVGVPAPVDTSGVKPLPGFDNASKPGFYTVKPGDTLIRIGLDAGQNFRDIVRWNSLENPNLIEVGQVLRIVPPGSDNPLVVVRPVTSGMPGTTTAVPALRPASAASNPLAAASSPQPTASSPQPTATEDDIAWIWPAQGKLIAGFDELKNKGYDIDGNAGDPIIAAGDGRVVYAGAGLRGYGNLIILKHNNTFLTAYAHNQTLLVKEDQSVKKGQKIAEMGNSDADRVKLHFEIRRQGKPVDPAKYLPAK